VWDPVAEPDQWAALASFLDDVTGIVGIDVSSTHALADGLTATEREAMEAVLGSHDVVSAEKLAISWLERRLPEERDAMAEACAIAHGFLRRALSTEVIAPGETTTQDVAWWLAQTAHDSGHRIWFHPGVTVQRAGDTPASPADGISDRVIEPGDLVHIDFGIIRNGYHTDQQQHGYVLRAGESAPPDSFVTGMNQANALQDILMEEMRPGRTGNVVLADSLNRGRDQGIRPVIYTHPIGLHGHAAGSTIGLWDAQDGVPGEGDYPVGEGTAWSIELAVEITIPEWSGQEGRIMVEENAFLEGGEVSFLDGRQERIWLIG
jgi:Xaa-Pro aminopeptidase